MNRKQRRAALKQDARRSASATPANASVAQLLAQAGLAEAQQRLDEAAQLYRRALALAPDRAQAWNNLACVLQTQGKRGEASACFARALALVPQLLDDFSGICATLQSLLPPLAQAMRRADAAWPQRLSIEEMFGEPQTPLIPAHSPPRSQSFAMAKRGAGIQQEKTGSPLSRRGADALRTLAALASDPLLHCVLTSAPIRDIVLERAFTSLRRALLIDTRDDALDFISALAQQCFLNEYVFATTPEEDARAEALAGEIAHSLAAGEPVALLALAQLAMYRPLHSIANAPALLARTWPAPIEALLSQQIRAPHQERALRDQIPRLTDIDDATSLRVRAQYEENPYPRWTRLAGDIKPTQINDFLRGLFPGGGFRSLDSTAPDVLVAGCGTGWQTTGIAQQFPGVQITAIDLSRASLAYAKRMTPPALAQRIDYAQADILKLGALERRFDVIYASGVLHHMADPFAAWRILLGLLKPDGLMNVGLYSEMARRDVVAARAFIAKRGYEATSAGIRQCRQDIASLPFGGVARHNDYFSLSECRDLLFHVQESRVSIPQIASFLAQENLRFIGFEFPAPVLRQLRALFAQNGWSLTDLARWHALETGEPGLFTGMYQFWVQKP